MLTAGICTHGHVHARVLVQQLAAQRRGEAVDGVLGPRLSPAAVSVSTGNITGAVAVAVTTSAGLFAGSCAVLDQGEQVTVVVVLGGGVAEPAEHGVHAAGRLAAVTIPAAGWLGIWLVSAFAAWLLVVVLACPAGLPAQPGRAVVLRIFHSGMRHAVMRGRR